MSIEPGPRSIPDFLTRALLLAICLVGAAMLALQIADWRDTGSLQGVLGLVGFAAALLLAIAYVAIRGTRTTARRALIELAAFGSVLVAVEFSIVLWTPDRDDRVARREHAASRLKRPFDTRQVSEVVQELRSRSIDALPPIAVAWHQPDVRRYLPPGFSPMSHASNAVVVECNEDGRYHLYRTDEWGFNNPAGLLARGDIDVALVGESYVLGHCLPTAYSLAGRIRAVYPRTANFGMSGNGTLAQLGSFREFVEPKRPRVVIWTVNPHFVSMREELDNPVLMRYFDPTFSQRLIERQDEVDRIVRQLAIPAQAELDQKARTARRQSRIERFKGAWQLRESRAQIRRLVGLAGPQGPGPDLTVFKRSLTLARESTERWGGSFIVVLLPIYAEVVADQVRDTVRHDHLARVVRQLEIPVVDGVALYKRHPDPAALYTMRMNNHPTAEGYELLADSVLEEIRASHPGESGK